MRDPRLTEQRNPRSTAIDELDALGIVDLINEEDRLVAAAVGEERESIARAMSLAVAAFRAGGRYSPETRRARRQIRPPPWFRARGSRLP